MADDSEEKKDVPEKSSRVRTSSSQRISLTGTRTSSSSTGGSRTNLSQVRIEGEPPVIDEPLKEATIPASPEDVSLTEEEKKFSMVTLSERAATYSLKSKEFGEGVWNNRLATMPLAVILPRMGELRLLQGLKPVLEKRYREAQNRNSHAHVSTLSAELPKEIQSEESMLSQVLQWLSLGGN